MHKSSPLGSPQTDKIGTLRMGAHGGTLLLDEIGDISLECKPSSSRVLQGSEIFETLGSSEPNSRWMSNLITATHQNWKNAPRPNPAPRDLFFTRPERLPLQVPPLRPTGSTHSSPCIHFHASSRPQMPKKRMAGIEGRCHGFAKF